MKITKLSLVAIAAMTLTTGAMAEGSEGIDLKIGGQAVVYYQTAESGGDTAFFDRDNSNANFGLQLNANGDIGNGFGVGIQATALNALGLNNNLVGDARVMQLGGGDVNAAGGAVHADASDYFGITKAYLTKQVANTTLKLGRQELPKSLSPLAFSESWNVTKNTFDAIVAINSDIPDTTIVGAYVSSSNGNGVGAGANMHSFNDLGAKTYGNWDADATTPNTTAVAGINSGAYMLTVANKSSKVVHPTLTYYALKDIVGAESGSAIWADVQVDAGLPVKLGLQGGQISPENNLDDTTVYGVKVTGDAGPVAFKVAYSSVDDGAVAVKNVGTGVKTPLYTQMVLNQDHISADADTIVLQGAMAVGPGKLIAQVDFTTDNRNNNSDYTELDVIYKFKALGTDMLAAYVYADDEANEDPTNVIRVWTRYNF